MKAQKKPVIIDYYIMKDLWDTYDIQKWLDEFDDVFDKHFEVNGYNLKVKTLEGISYDLTPDDVIIRGVKGEYYPCKKDIFNQTYDIIN